MQGSRPETVLSEGNRNAISIYGPLIMIAAVVFGGIAVKNVVGELMGSDEPLLFYGRLDEDLLDDYKGVIGVAHNAGDNRETTLLAIEHHADVVEIDVVSSSTTLYAGHSPPPEFAPPGSSTTSLATAWRNASEGPAVLLDLKESSRIFLVRVASFLNSRPSSDVIVVSRSRSALEFLDEQLPEATLMLSVATSGALANVIEDAELASLIDGVSAASGTLNSETIAELKERDLLVFAWVVNRIGRVNELVAGGVDGIITDNLALLELVGDPGDEEESSESLVTTD